MRRFAALIVWLALACSGRDPTEPAPPGDATVVRAQSSSQNVSGHVAGQIIGPSAQCGGALAEVGTFTGAGGGGTFLACITAMEQKGNGSLRFELTHLYDWVG